MSGQNQAEARLLRVVSSALKPFNADLAKVEADVVRLDAADAEQQRQIAILDRWAQTFDSQITIFRDGIRDQFKALRQELLDAGRAGRNGR